MFKTVFELQQFIEWAREQKIKQISVDSIKIEFSELAFYDKTELKDMLNSGSSTLADTEPVDKKEQEELEFWSGL